MYDEDRSPPRKRSRRRRAPSRRSGPADLKPPSSLSVMLVGVLLGLSPGILLAFRLPSSWFPNEWTQVTTRPPDERPIRQEGFGDPRINPASTPTPRVKSQHEKKTWKMIEVMERHPTPAPGDLKPGADAP